MRERDYEKLHFVKTANVLRAEQNLQLLATRPKAEIVGLALLYGRPGTGKSRWAEMVAYKYGWMHIVLEASDTAKTFLQRLYRSISDAREIRGTTNNVLQAVLQQLWIHPRTIVVDEVDKAFESRSHQLLTTIRDIVDLTESEIILIGMGNAKARLERLDEHYFSRCNCFIEFAALSVDEYTAIVRQYCRVTMSDDLISHFHQQYGGSIRGLEKEIHTANSIHAASGGKLTELNLERFRKARGGK